MTTPRHLLAGQQGFSAVSPAPGLLDEAAFDEQLGTSPDDALALLVQLANASDAGLRDLARRLAGRVAMRLGRMGPVIGAGIGRLHSARADGLLGDLDLEASIDDLAAARAARRTPHLHDLTLRLWAKPSTARCLVVDRSGSMAGDRLASMALAAAVVALRQGDDDYSVIAFGRDAVVVKAQGEHRPVEDVVIDLLALRGQGPTDLALGLRAAAAQLDRSTARSRATLLLSDCRVTAGDDPVGAARRLAPVHVLAPRGEADEARRLASTGGGTCVEVGGASEVPGALAALLA